MKFKELAKKARNWPIFSIEDCQKWFPATGRRTLIFQLSSYVKQGDLLRLKRGVYLLNQQPFPHPFAIASRLDPQAIISLEAILNRTGIIPDIPFATTAVTPGRTATVRLRNSTQQFIFRHIKPTLIFGFKLEEYPPYTARVAEPEKALLDLLWFHRFERDGAAYIHELRLTIPKGFSWKRFEHYAKQFHHRQITRLAKIIRHSPR